MTRSMQHFGEDDEAAATLKDLGYSDEEIGRTAGSLPSQMAAEDRLRVSLRALSAEHSESVQRRAEASAPPPNPKVFEKQERPTDSGDYERGRRDERYLKRNDPDYVKPPRKQRAKTPSDPTKVAMQRARSMGRLARAARGKRR